MTVFYPEAHDWAAILARPEQHNEEPLTVAREVFEAVKAQGDTALRRYTAQFDKAHITDFLVTPAEFAEAEKLADDSLKAAIRLAAGNITAFHKKQLSAVVEWQNPQGITCRQEPRPIEKVGLYVPGGSAPLFSTVLMLAIPARLAGCKEIVLCTPPDAQGTIHPAILWTAAFCGVTKVYKAGGIQAIAAMTFGTESIPKVYKLFGPGNRYVMAAKQLATHYGVAIDMPAGPSEVMVIADETANPSFIAADLLSQAEHGKDSQTLLLTWTPEILPWVEQEIERQLNELPRKDIAKAAMENSRFIVLKDTDTAIAMANEYAPEHLILCINNYRALTEKISNAGSVFLGNYSPESAGDYASGTNHTLPTNAYAKAYSGINMDAFIKKITFQEITREGLEYLAPTLTNMAENEQLQAHSNAVKIRIKK
ncbi:MAG: histidinol dehydrogenase [Prevotellaceae bacterium]|jgi:histidinol dehydrogenase|nr:histidinol dehydrogenase [Prevotellaceae bacterium]